VIFFKNHTDDFVDGVYFLESSPRAWYCPPQLFLSRQQ
jgi:hypothetical protein